MSSLLDLFPPILLDPRAQTLLVGLGTLVLFVWNKLRVDVVALISMTSLIVLGVVTPAQGISGFANEATIAVAAMLALSAGLLRTGLVEELGRWLEKASGKSEFRLLCLVMAIVIPVSAVINNTAAVAVLLPMVMGVARALDVPPSRILMPLSFAGQLGGTLTLIGTSTNLLVAGLVLDLGLERIGLFDITPAAAVLTAAGVLYILTVGRLLTPDRTAKRDLTQAYQLRRYLTSFRVLSTSPLANQSLAESRLGEREGILVIGIRRGEEEIRGVGGDTVVQPGDVLLAEGEVRDVARFLEHEGLEALSDTPEWTFAAVAEPDEGGALIDAGSENTLEERGEGASAEGEAEERVLAELLVSAGTFAVNRPLRQVGLRSRWGVSVLGLQRRGRPIHKGLAQADLQAGDLLLVEGAPQSLRALHEAGDFSLLGSVDLPVRRREKRWVAAAIMAGVVLFPALGLTQIVVSATAGVVLMFLTGCLTPPEAYEDVDWMVIVLLGAILPLGIAMQETGTAELLVQSVLGSLEVLGPTAVLALFYTFTWVLTGLISNNAAAVVMAPLAVATGAGLGVSPLPFIIGVMFAASNSFFTPIGYQTNTFIFGPGGYRFSDFIRVGGPLNLLLTVVAALALPFFFPF